jgi:hypothetical protein
MQHVHVCLYNGKYAIQITDKKSKSIFFLRNSKYEISHMPKIGILKLLISVWCFYYWLKGVLKFNCGLSYNSCCVCVNVIVVMVVVCCCRATCTSRRQLSTVTSCSIFASETGGYSSRWR